MRTISSRQHDIVKEFRRVARGDHELALLDGWHLVADAIAADVAIRTIAVTSGALRGPESGLLGNVRRGTDIVEVTSAVATALSPVRTPSGIVALVERRLWALPQLLLPSPALVVLAVDMQDPGNVGAMIRSAEAGGATGVVVAGRSADPWSWKALRAAMGSTLRVPVMTIPEAPSAVESIRAAHATAVACVVRNAKCMHDVDLRQPVVLIIGGEGAGLPDRLVAAADDRVSIPMSGQVNSLNAAVASALLVYEARRQRAERM